MRSCVCHRRDRPVGVVKASHHQQKVRLLGQHRRIRWAQSFRDLNFGERTLRVLVAERRRATQPLGDAKLNAIIERIREQAQNLE